MQMMDIPLQVCMEPRFKGFALHMSSTTSLSDTQTLFDVFDMLVRIVLIFLDLFQ